MKVKVTQTSYLAGICYKAGSICDLDEDQARNIPHIDANAAEVEAIENPQTEIVPDEPKGKAVEVSADKMVKKAKRKSA